MFDRTMEDISLLMTRADLNGLPLCALPKGYSFRFYRPGDEEHWARIETSAGEFAREEDAYPIFEEYYGRDKKSLETRMIFLLNAEGLPVGTSTAWSEEGRGRVHWVSLHQCAQGKRLSKPLVAETLRILRSLGHADAFLTTQPPSWVAIRVYLDCGFDPVISDEDSARGWALVRDKLHATDPTGFALRWREPLDHRKTIAPRA